MSISATSSPAATALLASTALAAGSVTFALSESLVLRSLLAAPPDVAGNALFQPFWRAFAPGGIALALLTSGGAAGAGAWAWRQHAAAAAPQGTAARSLMGWGAVAAVAHFAWGPAVATIIERLANHPVDSRQDVRKWLRLHHVRTLVSDVTALGCFIAAWFV